MQNLRMKQISMVLLVAALALGGCKKKEEGGAASADKAAEPAAKPAEPAAAAPAPAAPTGPIKGLPPKCTEYVDLANKFLACAKITDVNKKDTQQSIDDTKKYFTDTDNPTLATTNCQAGIDTLKKTAEFGGCTL